MVFQISTVESRHESSLSVVSETSSWTRHHTACLLDVRRDKWCSTRVPPPKPSQPLNNFFHGNPFTVAPRMRRYGLHPSAVAFIITHSVAKKTLPLISCSSLKHPKRFIVPVRFIFVPMCGCRQIYLRHTDNTSDLTLCPPTDHHPAPACQFVSLCARTSLGHKTRWQTLVQTFRKTGKLGAFPSYFLPNCRGRTFVR